MAPRWFSLIRFGLVVLVQAAVIAAGLILELPDYAVLTVMILGIAATLFAIQHWAPR